MLKLKLQYFGYLKNWLICKDPDAGKDWKQEEKGTTEDEMVGWHHRLNRHGYGWTPGVGDGQGGLACCDSWDPKESDTTEWLNWTELLYCSGFCHTLTWISHGCTCVPHPEPPSQLPPHLIPLGHPSAPALSTLSHALNLDWQSVSHMIINMFQCYSLKSSHPCLYVSLYSLR